MMPIPHTELLSRQTVEELEAARRAGVSDAGDALGACATASKGRLEEARLVFARLAVESADERVLFAAFQFAFRTGDVDGAERITRRRLLLAEEAVARGEIAMRAAVSRACTNLGIVMLTRGDVAGAMPFAARAVATSEELVASDSQNPRFLHALARDLGNLANVHETGRDLDGAERLNRRAVAIAESLGPDGLELVAGRLANLGDIAHARGHRDEAAALWSRARELFRTLGVTKWDDELSRKIEHG